MRARWLGRPLDTLSPGQTEVRISMARGHSIAAELVISKAAAICPPTGSSLNSASRRTMPTTAAY